MPDQPSDKPSIPELEALMGTPTHIIVLTWDADTGKPKLVIGAEINVFEARALLEAAIEDLWEQRPPVRVMWDGLDDDDDDDDDDDYDDDEENDS
jgi:phosphopantothenoylcysteine synthetase/decarboxylase